MSAFLALSPRVSVLPVIHGSGDCALEVRRVMLERKFDCLAVPLPPSFQTQVEQAIDVLPAVSMVTQRETSDYAPRDWSARHDEDECDDDRPALSYVPIDPCQPVIMALRIALAERIPRAFIDLETSVFRPTSGGLPDAYALKQVPMGLGDFFFSPDDPLHPDQEEDEDDED